METLPEDAPAPRLCHLIKWPDFDGYGFNLHGEKSKPGQYIGKVDKDSPADLAGLKANDRILEVNGTNISNENHKQVVQRIKDIPNETKLLVIDEKADQYYKARNIIVRGTLSNVEYLVTPVPRPNSTSIELTHVDNVTLDNGSIQSEDQDDGRATNVSDSHSGSGSSSPVSLSHVYYEHANHNYYYSSNASLVVVAGRVISVSPVKVTTIVMHS